MGTKGYARTSEFRRPKSGSRPAANGLTHVQGLVLSARVAST